MKRYQRLNPSFARIFIDHRKKKASFHYPSKMSTFEAVFNVFFNIWGMWVLKGVAIVAGFCFVGFAIFAGTNWDTVQSWTNSTTDVCVLENETTVATDSTWEDMKFPLIAAACFGGFFFLLIGVPFVGALIVVYNEKLLRKFPDFCVKYRLHSDGGCHYARVHKLKEKKFVVPLFENLFIDIKVAGDFKKYLKSTEVKEYNYFTKWKYPKTGEVKKEKNSEHWFAVITFTRIPKKGFLEIHFI
jgi:hypothetical protein